MQDEATTTQKAARRRTFSVSWRRNPERLASLSTNLEIMQDDLDVVVDHTSGRGLQADNAGDVVLE